ncbi:MAG: hypothetical protein JEY91_10920 [Spirochaetaceae bacterium]|nr:hypothetical protein [Spirochaetaceae bacterium]
MKDNINDVREQLIGKLNKFVQNTEHIYLNLGRDYPLLLNELDESVQKSSSSTDRLSHYGGSLETIESIITEGDKIIGDFNEAFTSMYSRDGELFDIISQGVTEMGALAEVIHNIKEGSIEMELISLNAMTVALKSGSAGKALSFITDELKKLSAQTIKLTDELTENGRHQLTLFEEFGKKIEIARNKQHELTENLDRNLKSSFTTSSKGLKESAEMMRSLSRSSVEVKEPLVRIMQEVQLQDIIRQSIDHIYISIEEFKRFDETWTTEKRLDELSFRKMMPDLCFSVLEDVKNEINGSSMIFEKNSGSIKSILKSLEKKRTAFIDSALNSSVSDNFSIIALNEESNNKITALIKEVNNSVKMRMDISREGLSILKDITILQRQFESFEPIITRFHNIIVASRIEVAKQEALSDMRDTVTKMTNLTENIKGYINNALDTIKHFLKTTENIINNYSAIIKKEMPGLNSLLNRTSSNQEKLSLLTDTLIECLRDFRIFSGKFLSLFRETDDNRKQLSKLSAQINEIESILHLIRDNAESDIFELQGNNKLQNWTIQNERLNSIIEKFTIFTHKKTASDLAGKIVEDLEEIVDSGEVTLF